MAGSIEPERPLRGYLRTLRSHRAAIALAAVLVPVSAFVASARQPATYQATSRVFLGQSAAPGDLGVKLQSDFKEPQRAVATQAELAHLPVVARRVTAVASTKNESVERLLRDSTVTPETGGDVLAFSVRNGNRALAVRLANEYAHQFTVYRRQLDRLPIDSALADLRARPAHGARPAPPHLARDLQLIRAVTGTGTAGVQLADAATKIRPKTTVNVLTGLALGIAFGIGIAFLWDALDTRVRSASQVAEALGVKALATIPWDRDSVSRREPAMRLRRRSAEVEAYRFLRAGLQSERLDPGKTIMVTSGREDEGKSMVATNLAIALAWANHHVALVDVNLRSPSIADWAGVQPHPGLTDVALGTATLAEAITPVTLEREDLAPMGSLRVLPAGSSQDTSGEFVATRAFDTILAAVSRDSDLVIIDSPPLLGMGDAVALTAKVDAILLVARHGVLDRTGLADLKGLLADSLAPVLGFAYTGARPREAPTLLPEPAPHIFSKPVGASGRRST